MRDQTKRICAACRWRWIGVLGVLLAVFFWLSLLLGSGPGGADAVWNAITGGEDLGALLVREIRLPRALTAVLAGSALAGAGLMMQTVFRNPLADPFVLGVSAGASLGVALVVLAAGGTGASLIAGLSGGGVWSLVVAAAAGAGAVMAIVLGLSFRVGLTTLLVVGLMIGYLVAACVSLLMFTAVPERLQAFFVWSYGSFDATGWDRLWGLFVPVLGGLLMGLVAIKPLNAMRGGDAFARSVGVRIVFWRIWVLAAASILAGAVTAFCGPIGFIGVAVPHLCRGLLRTADLRWLYPAVILGGGTVALFAGLVATLPGSDGVLPLNAVTALIGGPVVVWVLCRGGVWER